MNFDTNAATKSATNSVTNSVSNNASYGRLTGGLIAAWFVFALSASALHLFKTDPEQPPLALGLAVSIPLVVFLLWFATSAGFRQFALSLDPRTLTFVQSWRIAGFTFLVLYAAGLLPGVFALPAGWGDIAIGATAPLAALKLANFSRRRGYLLAGSGDFRPRDGSYNRHDREVDSSQRSRDYANDGAATELDSDVRGAAIPHASHYLHCPSQAMESGRALACWRAVTRFGKLTLMERSHAAWGTLRGLSARISASWWKPF
jgi:hypothetical protein